MSVYGGLIAIIIYGMYGANAEPLPFGFFLELQGGPFLFLNGQQMILL